MTVSDHAMLHHACCGHGGAYQCSPPPPCHEPFKHQNCPVISLAAAERAKEHAGHLAFTLKDPDHLASELYDRHLEADTARKALQASQAAAPDVEHHCDQTYEVYQVANDPRTTNQETEYVAIPIASKLKFKLT